MVEIERLPGEPFAKVVAEPTGALNREREVLLVWHRAARAPAEDPESPSSAPDEPESPAPERAGTE